MTEDKDSIDRHIGERIRFFRLERNLSQEQLASALGISFQQVQKYESGANRCAPSRLFKIARILDAPVDAFFPESGTTSFAPPRLDPQSVAFARAFGAIESAAARAAIRQLVAALTTPHQ